MDQPQTRPPGCARPRTQRPLRHLRCLALLAVAAGTAAAQDGTAIDAAVQRELGTLGAGLGSQLGSQLGASLGNGAAGGPVRVEVEPGRLDPRLRLAPCERVEARLPPGARAWGSTRVVLRCAQGATPWQVYLPVRVKVYAPAWVAVLPLAAGTVLQAEHLQPAEVDWAAERSPPMADAGNALGRRLARPLAPGQALRDADLARQQWFAAGERVQVVARGEGFSVSGEAQALAPGIEGQPVRVRTDAGQVLTGTPVGNRRVELVL